jgi:chromosome partitioning protein
MSSPHRIVFANEKGGTGKSTTAVHIAIALAYLGARVAAIDLDPRQRTTHRYLENRAETIRRRGLDLPIARCEVFRGSTIAELDALVEQLSADCDYLIFDTPGRDDEFARHVATGADTLVTPLNDSFVDFDLIGQVDPEDLQGAPPVFLCRADLGSAQKRAMATIQDNRREMDWVVVRNHPAYRGAQHAPYRQRAAGTFQAGGLPHRAGAFRTRDLPRTVPPGLTLLDKGHLGDLGTSHLVARQELRSLVAGLALPAPQNQRRAASPRPCPPRPERAMASSSRWRWWRVSPAAG